MTHLQHTVRHPVTPHLLEILSEATTCGVPQGENLMLDLREVDFLDSTSIGVLVRLHQACKRHDARIRLENMDEGVRRSLRVSGVLGLFGMPASPPPPDIESTQF